MATGPPTIDFTSCASESVLVAAVERVRRVDCDLAGEPADAGKRVRDLSGGDGDEDGVRLRNVAALPAEARDAVTGPLPPIGQPAADVSSADDGDLHAMPVGSRTTSGSGLRVRRW